MLAVGRRQWVRGLQLAGALGGQLQQMGLVSGKFSSKPAQLTVRDQHFGPLRCRTLSRNRVGGFDLAESEGFEGVAYAGGAYLTLP